MANETKVCQSCKASFDIDAEDFAFYAKIAVPPPTFCPECRLQRRLAFHNLINLYRRPCDLCGEEKISMFAPDAPYKVYCPQCWWSDNWDPTEYGRDYDFSRPFFEQFNELWHQVPLIGLSLDLPATQQSPNNNHAGHLKNCSLVFQADYAEDCVNCFYLMHSNALLDSALMHSCEFCFDCMNCYKNSRCIGLRGQVTESINCAFLKDSANCQDCFASANLRNKKYYIFNKPYVREEYFNERAKWDLGSYRTYQKAQVEAEKHWSKFIPKPCFDDFSTNCTGNYVFQSKNCKECYEVIGAENCKYMFMIEAPVRDCYDITSFGSNLELSYECEIAGENASRIRFSQESGINLHDAEYCKTSLGGAHHFGCVSIKKGEYCIFNKKYSKDEYHLLRTKIILHMNEVPYKDKRERVYKYGEFFPAELSPFAYNESLANSFFPLSKEKATEENYGWHEQERRTYSISTKTSELPDHIKDAKDSIVGEVIECEKCKKGYKITKIELDLLRNMNAPLPRQCPFCRIQEKFDQWVKNMRIFERVCSQCGNHFRTQYPEKEFQEILCKQCYQQTIT